MNYDILMPRFVLLLHETPAGYSRPTHYDLMLEHGEVLFTWALEQVPTVGKVVAAERLPDHRLLYLDYEGSVSGDRGAVNRIDRGDFDWVSQAPDRYEIIVTGRRLRGTLLFEQDANKPHRWRVALSG